MKMMLAVQGVSVLQTRFLLDCKQCLKPVKPTRGPESAIQKQVFHPAFQFGHSEQCVQTTLHMTDLFKHTEPLTVAATLNLFLEIDT